jgi:hypothetical protein
VAVLSESPRGYHSGRDVTLAIVKSTDLVEMETQNSRKPASEAEIRPYPLRRGRVLADV